MEPHPPRHYRFGVCELDLVRRVLLVSGRPTALQPRTFDLLVLLVRRAGEAIHKDELIREIWPTVHVTDAVLTTAIARVRRSIGDDGRVITTLHGVGYRFDAEVEVVTPGPATSVTTTGALEPGSQLGLTTTASRSDDGADIEFPAAQWARVQALARLGSSAHALQLLEAIEAELQPSASVVQLKIRLLRHRLRLVEAESEITAALAAAESQARPLELAGLRLEQARLAELRVDVPQMMLACEQALTLLGTVPDDGGLVAQLLAVKCRAHYLRGEYGKVLELVQHLRLLAVLPRDACAVALGGQHRCYALLRQGQGGAALQEAADNLAFCVRNELIFEQAEAFRLLGYLAERGWRHVERLQLAMRAESLCGSHGDLTLRDRARSSQLYGLIALGRLDEAAELLPAYVAEAATDVSGLARWNFKAVQVDLDWRRGQHDSALALLQAQASQFPDYARGHGNQQLLLLAKWSLSLGRTEPAREVLERLDTWLPEPDKAMLSAGLSLIEGDRADAKARLRRAWIACRTAEGEAWEVALSLGWLLIEDQDPLGLDEVLSVVYRLPEQQSARRLLHEARLTRARPGAPPGDAFFAAGQANSGIVNRHAWLLEAEGSRRWATGQQQLTELFGTAWV